MKQLFYISFSLLFLFSCKNDSSKIYSNFYLRFDDTEGKVTAEAVFFKGDTIKNAIPFAPDNGVFFDGGAMEQKELINRIAFRSERTTDSKPYFEFKFKNAEKKEEKFDLKVPFISKFNIENNRISIDSGFLLKWEGNPLNKSENLVLFLSDSKNVDKNIQINGPTSNSSVKIDASKLTGITIGEGTIYLVRKYSNEEIIGDLRRSSQSEFYTKTMDVHFVK